MAKRKKKTPRQRVVKRLDTITSLYIRLRDEHCVVCGSPENLTNGHLFSRMSYSSRWDITEDGNCHCQCWGCNFSHEHDSYPFTNWYIKKFSYDKWEELHRRYKKPKKYTTPQLEDLYVEIKNKYAELQKQVR